MSNQNQTTQDQTTAAAASAAEPAPQDSAQQEPQDQPQTDVPLVEQSAALVTQDPVVETPKPARAAFATREELYDDMVVNGTEFEKAVLAQVRDHAQKNSGPYLFGVKHAVSSQHEFLGLLLTVFESQPRNTLLALWAAILHLVAKNSSPTAAFGEQSMMYGTQYWVWGQEKYKMYTTLVLMLYHMADPERSKNVKQLIGRASIDRLPMTQAQRDGLNLILKQHGM